jgi:hypothetical protein
VPTNGPLSALAGCKPAVRQTKCLRYGAREFVGNKSGCEKLQELGRRYAGDVAVAETATPRRARCDAPYLVRKLLLCGREQELDCGSMDLPACTGYGLHISAGIGLLISPADNGRDGFTLT